MNQEVLIQASVVKNFPSFASINRLILESVQKNGATSCYGLLEGAVKEFIRNAIETLSASRVYDLGNTKFLYFVSLFKMKVKC